MPRAKAGALYDEDDMYDDDDDYDDYDDYDEGGAPAQPAQRAAAAPKQAAGKAAGSAFAQTLRNAAAAAPQHSSAAAAAARSSAAGRAGAAAQFDFSTPSPDELARQAAVSAKPAAGVSLAPSKTPTVAAARQQHAAQRAAAPEDAAAAGVAELSLDGGSSSTSAGGSHRHHHDHPAESHPPWRPPSEYVMEPDLAKDVAAALAAAAASAEGGRTPLHLVVMGHVDAGKSTLMGRLLHDLGYVSQKEAHKNARDAATAGKSSFAWAWVLDERPEERSRGVTVDVAMARFVTRRHSVTLLDAPGHRDFIPNMISGAAQADAALLVVDGSPGGFEAGFGDGAEAGGGASGASYGGAAGAVAGGQTREHAQLARALGVEQLAVVVTKLDTADYSQARFEHIKGVMLPFLKTCGFKEASLQWLPAVGPEGQNLVAPPTEPRLASWWRGVTVVGAVDAFKPKPRRTDLPLRLPVHDVVRGKHGQVVVGGKLESGAVKVGSRVLLLPSREVGTVKQLEVDGQAAAVALSGDSADVTLSGVEPHAAWPGSVLCHPSFPVRCAAAFEARVLVLDVAIPILRGHPVTLHVHTAREAGRITALLAVVDARTGEPLQQRPRCLLKGQTALVQVRPDRPVCLEVHTDFRPLARVALREGGRTIALGLVTKVLTDP